MTKTTLFENVPIVDSFERYYNDTVGRKRATALFSATSVKVGVRALFKTVLDELDDPKAPRMCLVAGSVSGEVLSAPGLRPYVVGEMQVFLSRFTELLSAAKEAGELSSEFEPEVTAQIVFTYLQGLFRTALVSYDRKQIERQIEVLLTGLGF